MKKFTMLLVCLLSLGVQQLFAQRTLTGTVISSEDNEPLPGVNVILKGTTQGTITDFDGNFSLKVPDDAEALVFSFMGMQTKEVPIGSTTTFNVTLDPESIGMEEIVVTAMGITRAEKTLGYAATTVKSDDIVTARSTNVANALSGRVAGVQVNSTSSDPGSVSNIVIRGFSSINGSNQPLYVVDGVPMGNNFTSSTGGKNMTTSGISNIPSENIESMTVLKGAAATALYGSRAANGVIIINTKKGKKGADKNFTIEYSGNVSAYAVSVLPEFQNDFGQGWNGKQTYIENGSWGPKLDGSMQVYGPIWNYQQQIHEYSAKKNNVKDFFEVGWSNNHNVALSAASEDNNFTYRLAYGYTSDDGIMPSDNDKFKRNVISLVSTYDEGRWFKLSSNISFARSKTDAVENDQGTTVIDGLLEMPRDVSIVDMEELSSAFNTPEAYYTPYGITNPYWALKNNYMHIDAKQVFGKLQVDVTPIEQLTLTYRYGFDYSDYDKKVGKPEIKLDDALINEDYGYAPSNMNQSGYVYTRYSRTYELNHDIIANFADRYLDDKFDVNLNIGTNINERFFTRTTGRTDELGIATGFWQLSNGATKNLLTERQEKRRAIGLFGDVTFGWGDMVYLEVSARNDWSSTLPIDANSYFYSGATLSWIFTKVLPQNDVLSFGKARFAFGKTGNDTDPYRTNISYEQASADGYYDDRIADFPIAGKNAFVTSSTAGSTKLKPEMTKEIEFGLNLQFFKNRVGVDASFYNRTTDDQIFELPVDPACGYSAEVTNVGKVRNRGFELLINTTPVRNDKLRWDVDFNFAMNKNKVLEMPESLEDGRISIYRFSAGNDAVYMYAEKGLELGTFYTYLPTQTEDGKTIVDENGNIVLGSKVESTGKSINNKWTGGVTTSLTAYGITLSAALDIRYGGYMFSRTKNLMQFTGNDTETTYNGRNPFVIPNSVVEVEEGVYAENTVPMYLANSSFQGYFNDYGWGHGGEAYLIDRSYAKLRNISLAYSLPQAWVDPIKLTDVTVSLFCNNVFTWTPKSNHYIDPETTTVDQESFGDLATQFGELYTNPACRIFGLNLSAKF